MYDFLLVLIFGFLRSLYISFANGFVLWLLFKTLESFVPIHEPVSYWLCLLVAFIPGFIISCIKVYKQIK